MCSGDGETKKMGIRRIKTKFIRAGAIFAKIWKLARLWGEVLFACAKIAHARWPIVTGRMVVGGAARRRCC